MEEELDWKYGTRKPYLHSNILPRSRPIYNLFNNSDDWLQWLLIAKNFEDCEDEEDLEEASDEEKSDQTSSETDSQLEKKRLEERERLNSELEERRKFEESKRLAAERDLRTRQWVQEVSRYISIETKNEAGDNNVIDKRPASITNFGDTNVTKKARTNNSGGAWKSGLKGYLKDPGSSEFTDDKVVIIKDKFPKARHHFLVLPKQNIPNLKSLKQENVDILRYMLKKGQELVARHQPESRFRFGFHAVPSMSHLHLHVISLDMDSTYLKTKKHWNSFVTTYFVDAEEVIQQLEINGSYTVISAEQGKALLNTPLRCHQCSQSLPTMPKLKQHILTHFPK